CSLQCCLSAKHGPSARTFACCDNDCYLDLGSNDAYCSCQLRTNQYDEFASDGVLAVASWRSITVSADTFKIIGYCHQISQFTCGQRQHGAMLLLKNSIAS
ncbi:MAG TPA: hypothetical protein VHL14_01910, partial [Steroidobacteraceae bacterium]|nr:hypothetical protein [Steroidobacteraceae bacterium]